MSNRKGYNISLFANGKLTSMKTYVYVGEADPPDYCSENFVDQDDLVALLEGRIKNAFYAFGEKTIMNCPRCGALTEAKHMHDCAHGIPETHMGGSERYECVDCGYVMRKIEGEKQGLKFFLD